ncbi:uncharacterized protein BP01DRAFT_357293 [Aspergillus saccharolyticus JOP 1030-1]|uniref:Uncharacterized protein n=1 Tax=Aspergillus saccharolyticus JOP 1030-1 TaxID=1450539 RepID=A0A319ADL2_9EURO|nr:hypothetical protein BP01DRAFT_357293 [Aspergillus saccharolyticus JOP 1030-1]PYH44942.1 hypothetical protein BP01DRAFT_357293 [Aspergillus saccharolyticus JOP 1030-1]
MVNSHKPSTFPTSHDSRSKIAPKDPLNTSQFTCHPSLRYLLGANQLQNFSPNWLTDCDSRTIYRYFGRKPTSVTSESNVRIGESAMPWEQADSEGKVYKYQYHPHGDKSQPLRNAPSALNTVIVPNVTLPADLHERFNKYGKEEWDY